MRFIALVMIAFSVLVANAPAQLLTDRFSGAGGAWTSANQPNFAGSTGGTLYSDQAIASGTNNSTSNTGATLSVAGALSQGGGIYSPSSQPPGYLYVGGSTPTLTLSTSNILNDVNTVSLSITAAFGTFASSAPTLSLGGSLLSFNVTDTGTSAMKSEFYDYTWTWDVSQLSSISNIDISWQTPAAHTAYSGIELTQDQAQSVPEPSTWGLILVAGVGFAVLRSRQLRFTH